MFAYSKALVAVIGAGVVAAQVALEDSLFDAGDALTVIVAVVTAINVYLVANEKKTGV